MQVPRAFNSSSQETHVCVQCGLPYGRGGTISEKDGLKLHFCCYGCSFTYSVVGEAGEAGTAGLFLARLGFSAFLAMNVMILSWALYDQQWLALGIEAEARPFIEKLLFVLSIPVMLFVGWPYIRNAGREFSTKRLSMDSLIALGTFSAFGFSTYQVFTGGSGLYFDTATMTLVLVTTGRYLEANAKTRTSSSIRQLLNIQPDTARKVVDGVERVVPATEIRVGEVIKILPGERIPLDGTIAEGTTTVNESMLTGEFFPSRKKLGDRVFAATVNNEGTISIRVTASSTDTVHARVVQLMEEAQRTRSPIQQYVDSISAAFIPAVIGLSLMTFLGWSLATGPENALLHALTVLVVACPCALGIGTPLAGTIAIGRSANQGIFVKSTTILERAADTRHVVFDKTGTLTRGELRLWEVRTDMNERRFLSIVASLEQNSTHPLGRAIADHVRSKSITPLPSRNVSVLPGLGIKGEVQIDGRWMMVQAGSAELFQLESDKIPEVLRHEGSATTMYAGWDGALHGSVIMNDTIRHNAKTVVRTLGRLAIETYILSGDSQAMTQSVADALSVKHAFGKLFPQQKLEIIHDLKSRAVTMMVGDGINDAPALASADVGVTLGSATDIAKESADVTILGDHLEKIPWLIRYARKTLGVIRWNLIWAFGYNAIGIALAVAGLLQPILAAAAMIFSSLFVIINSRRLASTSIR